MFYLLKNNRIIDTNNQTFKEEYTAVNGITHYSIETPNETHIHYTFGGGEYKDNIYKFHSASIKKQSENVFDLIEVGDLVKDDNCLYEVSEISNGEKDNGRKSAISQPAMFKHWEWEIEAIYKPNSKGDYIKIWEKKYEQTNIYNS